jgi:hypothetical protein
MKKYPSATTLETILSTDWRTMTTTTTKPQHNTTPYFFGARIKQYNKHLILITWNIISLRREVLADKISLNPPPILMFMHKAREVDGHAYVC